MGNFQSRPGSVVAVADALFSKAQQRVLGVLFGNPDRSFYSAEIIKLAASGSGAAQRELARLESAKLVTTRRVGNQKHYQADHAAPVFTELCALVRKTSGLADHLRRALAPRASEIRVAFIYGSVAKGQDAATGGVDLMIVSDRLTYSDLFPLLDEASKTVGRAVNPTVYSSTELAKRIEKGNAFIMWTLKQPKIWLIGSRIEPQS